MSEFAKSLTKALLMGVLAAAISLQTQIIANPALDDYTELMGRPSTLLLMLAAVIPVIVNAWMKSPAQGAAMDAAIEAKADAKAELKAEAKVDNMIQTGQLQVRQ